MNISTDAEKGYDKIQCPFVIKYFNKLEIKGNFLNLMNRIYKNPTANVIPNTLS